MSKNWASNKARNLHPAEYECWVTMRKRCLRSRNRQFPDYGGRGITICDRWLKSFWNFYADMGDRPKEMSIDRIDNNGPYSPDNCRWATVRQQARNRRSNRLIEYRGETLCLTEWGEKTGIQWSVIQQRLDDGWTVDAALTVPVQQRSPKLPPVTWNGITKTPEEWSLILGAKTKSALSQRLRKGWTLERAMTEPFSHSYHGKKNARQYHEAKRSVAA